MSANPPAGWYPDPHGQAELRYWDGNTWTEHTSGEPPAGATQLDQPQAAPEQAAQAQGPIGFQDPGAGAGYGDGGRKSGPPKGLLIGLGVLVVAAAVVGILFLTGVLGGGDDGGDSVEDDVRSAVEEVLDSPDDAEICENFSDDFLEDLEGGASACESEVEDNEDVDYEIGDITVDEDEETAEVEATIDDEDVEIDMVNEDGDWKVNDAIAGVCCLGDFVTTDTGTTTGTDTGTTPTGADAEVREAVEKFLTAYQQRNSQEFCNATSIRFARDHGVRGDDDQVIERCPRRAQDIMDQLIFLEDDPQITSVELPGGDDFQTATVELSDTSVIEVIGSPGEFWFVDTFR